MANEILWQGRKRVWGFPVGMEVYAISSDRLFFKTGFLSLQEKQYPLHRIRDVEVTCSLGQRLLGVGTVRVRTNEGEVLSLENICEPLEVKELLYAHMEYQKRTRRILSEELFHRYWDMGLMYT